MISFGTVFLELVFGRLHMLPEPGEEVFTDEFAVSCGGAVTCATAAAAGGARAGLCTVLGDDVGSQVVTEHCAATGVDLSPSVRVGRPAAGITVVLNFAGDRGFVTHVPPDPSGQGGRDAELARWLDVIRRERPGWCYMHAGPGLAPLLREARELGCRIVLDTSLGSERDRDAIVGCVRLADVFVPNADELIRLAGQAGSTCAESAAAAAAAWGTQLVVTRGAAGALVASPDGSVAEVTDGVGEVTVRDLTGAGDNFAGAMIAALLGGAPLADAVVAANEAGSRAVGQLGAVGQVGGAGAGGYWPLRTAALAGLAPGRSGAAAEAAAVGAGAVLGVRARPDATGPDGAHVPPAWPVAAPEVTGPAGPGGPGAGGREAGR